MSKILIFALVIGVVTAGVSWEGHWLVTSSYSTNSTYCGYPPKGTNASSYVSLQPGFNIDVYTSQGKRVMDYFPWSVDQLTGTAFFNGWYEAGNLTVSGNLLYADVFLNHTDYPGSWCGWTMVRFINNSANEGDFISEEFSDDLVFMQGPGSQAGSG